MLGLEFVVRSQKMRATQIPCDQAQILTSCISDGGPKCSRPAPTLGSMVALRLRVASCTSLHLNGCVRVLRLVAPALDWLHGGHFGSSATNQIDL